MLKVAVFLALAAVCLAQTPNRPNIAETFSSAVSEWAVFLATRE